MRTGGDRLVSLAGLLAARGLRYSVVKTGEARHLVVRIGKARAPTRLRRSLRPDSRQSGDSRQFLRLPPARRVRRAPDCRPQSGGRSVAALPRRLYRRRGGAGLGHCDQAGLLFPGADAEGHGRAGEGDGGYRTRRDGKGRADTPVDRTGGAPGKDGFRPSRARPPGYRSLVAFARRACKRAGLPEPMEAGLPWSDDLGLTLGGLPALTISLLPEAEAAMLASREAAASLGDAAHGGGLARARPRSFLRPDVRPPRRPRLRACPSARELPILRAAERCDRPSAIASEKENCHARHPRRSPQVRCPRVRSLGSIASVQGRGSLGRGSRGLRGGDAEDGGAQGQPWARRLVLS